MTCPCCEREVEPHRITKHHLQTRKVDKDNTVLLCRECHSTIHRFYSNKQLAVKDSPYATLGGLLAQPEFATAVAWIAKQDPRKHPRIRASRQKGQRR